MVEIIAEDLSKRFKVRSGHVIDAMVDVGFDVADGELLVLLGPSGCGKTTTLRCLAGLEHPDKGSIRFGNHVLYDSERHVEVPTHRRDIGMVFQSFALWPHMSASRNIEYALKTRRSPKADRADTIREVARMVDLQDDILAKRPGQLSGGQQQRVALARALVARPNVVLFDEPLSNLDALLREQLRIDLKALHRRIGFSGVYVTHDLAEALALGDRVAVMRDGGIRQIGAPADVFDRPVDRGVARLVGLRPVCSLGYADGRWSVVGGGSVAGRLPVDGNVAGEIALLARPDRIRLAASDAAEAGCIVVDGGRVEEVSNLGSQLEIIVTVGGNRLRVLQQDGGSRVPQVDDQVRLVIPTAACRFYDDEGRAWPHEDVQDSRSGASASVVAGNPAGV